MAKDTKLNILEAAVTNQSEELSKLRKTTEGLEANWNLDREDFKEFKNKFAHWEVEMVSLQNIIKNVSGLIQKQVAETVAPISEEITDLKNILKDKKILAIDGMETKKQLKPRWKFWSKT